MLYLALLKTKTNSFFVRIRSVVFRKKIRKKGNKIWKKYTIIEVKWSFNFEFKNQVNILILNDFTVTSKEILFPPGFKQCSFYWKKTEVQNCEKIPFDSYSSSIENSNIKSKLVQFQNVSSVTSYSQLEGHLYISISIRHIFCYRNSYNFDIFTVETACAHTYFVFHRIFPRKKIERVIVQSTIC